MSTDSQQSQAPPTILVGNGLYGGGAENRFSYLAHNLFEGKVSVAVISGGVSDTDRESGRIFHLRWKHRGSYLRMAWDLRNILRQKNFRVIMAFGFFPIFLTALALTGLRNRPRFILSEITRPLASTRQTGIARNLAYTLLRRLFYPRADVISANSIDGVEESLRLANREPGTGIRLPNIMDPLAIAAAAAERSTKIEYAKPYVVCVARLIRMKRIDMVIDAMQAVVSQQQLFLVIVGDGPERAKLKALVEQRGLKQYVQFAGHCTNPIPILRNASAFILSSEFEGFSNSLLEAMFCDIPIITSFCSSDSREMVKKGAALGFEVGDVATLSKHILSVVFDDGVADELIAHARAYRLPHSRERALEAYERLIRTLADQERLSEHARQ